MAERMRKTSRSTADDQESREAIQDCRSKASEGFFNELFALLDEESRQVTNAEMESGMRAQIRKSVKGLKDSIGYMQRFHQYRFSDRLDRHEMAAEEAARLVHIHNFWFRHDPSREFLRGVARIDEQTGLQPAVFGKKFASVARATLNVTLIHYVRFDDAFEESRNTKTPEIWSSKVFGSLCKRLDKMSSLSFKSPVSTLVQKSDKSNTPPEIRTKPPRPGRPNAKDPQEEMILSLWRSGEYKSYVDCAAALPVLENSKVPAWKRIKRVVVRDNKRRSRRKLARKKGA